VKVCVVGSGGREHVFATTLARTAEVVITPGSPGIEGSISEEVLEIEADLYVIGPEAQLVNGMADELRNNNKVVFGPGADGAKLEGSKKWMKNLVEKAGVPTAKFQSFNENQIEEAILFLSTMSAPYVVKTDGLAAGKGVLVTEDYQVAVTDIKNKLSGKSFGLAGQRVIIEEGLIGREVSLFAVCDGEKATLIPTAAQDHKRLLDLDNGPNTGGMGCYSPIPSIGPANLAQMMEIAIHPTMDELINNGIDYRGFLYAGFMMTADGPKLLEYNVRFGDPEAQAILPRIEGDLAEILFQAAKGDLREEINISSDSIVTIVCSADGYPINPRKGDLIHGIEAARAIEGATVHCAGVDRDSDGKLITSGGRILNVSGRGPDLHTARQIAYAAAQCISWAGMHMRWDIASDFKVA
jgi:phosphoribosylamine--glycine ligase